MKHKTRFYDGPDPCGQLDSAYQRPPIIDAPGQYGHAISREPFSTSEQGVCPNCLYRSGIGIWCAEFGAGIIATRCSNYKERK
jgi:hypothetical protein